MVLNSNLAVTVANLSANLCQHIACNPERLTTDQLFDLLLRLPLRLLRSLSLSLWSYLSFNPRHGGADSDDDRISHSD